MGRSREDKYVIYVGEGAEYARDFGNGKKICLKKGVVTPVTDEIALILKDIRNVHPVVGQIYDKVGKNFKEDIIRED